MPAKAGISGSVALRPGFRRYDVDWVGATRKGA